MPAIPARTAYCLRGLTPWETRAYAFQDIRGRKYCIYHGKLYAGPVYTRYNNETELFLQARCLGHIGSGFSFGGPKNKMWCTAGGFEIEWTIISEFNCINCKHYSWESEEECGTEGGAYYCACKDSPFVDLGEPHEMNCCSCKSHEYDGRIDTINKWIKDDRGKLRFWSVINPPWEDNKCMRRKDTGEYFLHSELEEDWPTKRRI